MSVFIGAHHINNSNNDGAQSGSGSDSERIRSDRLASRRSAQDRILARYLSALCGRPWQSSSLLAATINDQWTMNESHALCDRGAARMRMGQINERPEPVLFVAPSSPPRPLLLVLVVVVVVVSSGRIGERRRRVIQFMAEQRLAAFAQQAT